MIRDDLLRGGEVTKGAGRKFHANEPMNGRTHNLLNQITLAHSEKILFSTATLHEAGNTPRICDEPLGDRRGAAPVSTIYTLGDQQHYLQSVEVTQVS